MDLFFAFAKERLRRELRKCALVRAPGEGGGSPSSRRACHARQRRKPHIKKEKVGGLSVVGEVCRPDTSLWAGRARPLPSGALPLWAALRPIHPRIFVKSGRGLLLITLLFCFTTLFFFAIFLPSSSLENSADNIGNSKYTQ